MAVAGIVTNLLAVALVHLPVADKVGSRGALRHILLSLGLTA